jgi:hypothetical protein
MYLLCSYSQGLDAHALSEEEDECDEDEYEDDITRPKSNKSSSPKKINKRRSMIIGGEEALDPDTLQPINCSSVVEGTTSFVSDEISRDKILIDFFLSCLLQICYRS